TRDGREIYGYNRPPGVMLFDARKLPNGQIVCVSNQGIVQVIEAVTGRELRTLPAPNKVGGWGGIEPLPGGRFLVALMNLGVVRELDVAGQMQWECTVPGACHATRLPNGHTLVASLTRRQVIEVDRAGKTVAEVSTTGRPWRIHWR